MSMHAESDGLTVTQVLRKPLNAVRKHVRCGQLNSRGEVDDRFLLSSRLPDIDDGFRNFQSKIQFSTGETFGGILKHDFRIIQSLCILLGLFSPSDGNIHDTGPVGLEYNTALRFGGGIVDMHDGTLRPSDRLIGFFQSSDPGFG